MEQTAKEQDDLIPLGSITDADAQGKERLKIMTSTSTTTSTPSKRVVSPGVEYCCGVLAGFGKVFAGHPFDTIKGRVQSGAFPNATQALRGTLNAEGVSALYQGVIPPCLSVCFVSGVLFYCNSIIRTALQPDPQVMLTYGQMAIAGGGAGAITALVLTPMDSIKLRQQIYNRTLENVSSVANSGRATPGGRPPSAAPSVASIVRKLGPVGLYRGFLPTVGREIGTFGIYFPLCEFIKHRMVRARRPSYAAASPVRNGDVGRLPLTWRIAAAGISGVLCWLPVYPIDQVKTAMQLSSPGAGTPVTMGGVAARLYRSGGARGMYRGLAPCLLRAGPAYATHMTMFDAMISAYAE